MTPERPDTPELAAALQAAYAGTLKHVAQLLAVWRSNLSDERAKQLEDFQAKGLTLGALATVEGTRVRVRVVMTDHAGGLTALDEISLPGGSLAIN